MSDIDGQTVTIVLLEFLARLGNYRAVYQPRGVGIIFFVHCVMYTYER